MRHLGFGVLLLSVVLSGQESPRKGIDRANLDTTCKPCTDIWRYANGGFLDRNPIPPSFSAWGKGSDLEEENRERLTSILEEAAANPKAIPGSNERKIGDFYASCMDTAAIANGGLGVIQPELARVSQIHSVEDLTSTLTAFQEYWFGNGLLGPFVLFESQNLQDARAEIASVGPNDLSLPARDYYLSSDAKSKKVREQFLNHVATILEAVGETGEKAFAAAKTVLAFETVLAESMMSSEQLRDSNARYHPMAVEQLSKLSPNYNWKTLLAKLKVSNSTTINVIDPEFIKTVDRHLTTTPLEAWRTWLRWRVLDLAAPYLTKTFVDLDFAFHSNALQGIKEPKTRKQLCTETVNDGMTDALGEAFVRKHFPAEARRRMQGLVESVRITLREELARAAWMSPETRKNAIKKIDAFQAKIGYPDKWRDYSPLEIDRSSYFRSLRANWKYDRQYGLAKIGKPVDRSEWFYPPQSTNAYAVVQRNEIVFTAGILMPPVFDPNADDVVNYATIGALVGHEMSHHFDDQGSKYDAQGNLNDWWTSEDRKRFAERVACVIDQFDKLDIGGGLYHNGKLVVGEALADLGSISLAYKAYKRSLEGKTVPPTMDGFTLDQQFFIAFATKFSTAVRPEAAALRIKTDPHPLPQYRAIGTLQNVLEFQQAFQCKAGDSMFREPATLCHLW